MKNIKRIRTKIQKVIKQNLKLPYQTSNKQMKDLLGEYDFQNIINIKSL